MNQINYGQESCERLTLFDQPALYYEGRIPHQQIPQGLYAYDLRGSDYDFNRPVMLEPHVTVNHAGTIITAHPIQFSDSGRINIQDKLGFLGESCTLREFEISIFPERATISERETQRINAAKSEGIRKEGEFIHYPGDAFALYQLRYEESIHRKLFEPYDWLLCSGLCVEKSEYDAKYVAPLPKGGAEPLRILEDIYYRFNVERPDDFTGHSFSISDVIALKINDQITAYYVDRIGFKELTDFVRVNPFKNAEMVMEDDYGMIDGVINNGKRDPERERPSVKERLSQPVLREAKLLHRKADEPER